MFIRLALPVTIVFAIALQLSSCNDTGDTIIIQPDPVVFYMDSISVWLPPGTGSGSSSQIFQQTISASRVKVEYSLHTNADSIHGIAWVKDSSNGTPPHIVEQQYYWYVDSLVSYTMDLPSQPVHIRLEVRMNVNNSIVPNYVRLKNIRVTKQ